MSATTKRKHQSKLPEDRQLPIKTHGVKKRYTVLNRDNFMCHYCRCKLTMDSMTYDHKIPQAHEGPDDIDNLVASCEECNTLKGTIPYHIFVEAMNAGTVHELVQDHREVMSAWAKYQAMGNTLARSLINRSSIIKSIATHLEKGQIDPDLLDDLDEHINDLHAIKEEYVDFICNHAPE